jgi:hypothetical protein
MAHGERLRFFEELNKITGTFPLVRSLSLPWVVRAPDGARLYLYEVKMASHDFRPARTEGSSWHPKTGSLPLAPGWLGAAHEIAGSRLDDFLYAGQPRSVRVESEAVLEAPATDAMPPAVSNDCPHCAARLSAVELKMERCLACGWSLRSVDDCASQPLTIGI